MLPEDSAARKRIPMFTGLLKYFPDALAAVAAHSFANNEKHNPGEPLYWAREKSSDHEDCIVRHMTDRSCTDDLDAKIEGMTATAWRSLAQLQLDLERKRSLVAEEEKRAADEQAILDRQEFSDQRDPGAENDWRSKPPAGHDEVIQTRHEVWGCGSCKAEYMSLQELRYHRDFSGHNSPYDYRRMKA